MTVEKITQQEFEELIKGFEEGTNSITEIDYDDGHLSGIRSLSITKQYMVIEPRKASPAFYKAIYGISGRVVISRFLTSLPT